jgi:hypothetical protein
VPSREGDGFGGVIAGSNELLGAPVLDAFHLVLGKEVELCRSHLLLFGAVSCADLPPEGD